MPGPILCQHAVAGRLTPTRLAVRVVGSTVAPPLDTSTAIAAEAPLAEGTRALGPVALDVSVRTGDARARIETRLRNVAPHPVFVESVVIGARWSGPDASALRFLRHGWQSWSFTGARDLDDRGEPPFASGPWLRGLHHAVPVAAPDRSGWHESDLVTVVGASTGGPTCLAGALERGTSFGVVYARRAGADVALEIELRLDAVLDPGASRALEPAVFALGTDASALLGDFAADLGREGGARAASPFVSGWCTWYHFFHEVTESDLLRNLEVLSGARDELPVDVVQLDDGYQRATGDWLETNEKFPSGLPALAAAIRDAGFTPGLWTAPFCAVAESRLFREHPDWMLRQGDELHRGLLHPVWARDAAVYALDPTRDEVIVHLGDLFRALVERGFPYLKLDFLYVAAMRADAADPRVPRAERLRRGLEAVRAGAGDDAFLLGCGCPLGAAVGVVDGMRIGPDVAPWWRAPDGVRIPGIEETVPATRSAVRSVLARAWMHRRLWLNDPDCLMARGHDTQLSAGERRALAAVIAATGGMFVLSDDLSKLTGPDRELARRCHDVARGVDALGLPGRARVPELLAEEIPGCVVAGDSAGATVALVNAGDAPATREVDLAQAGAAPLAGAPVELLGGGGADGPNGGDAAAEPTGATLSLTLPPRDAALFEVVRAFPLAVFCDFDGTFSVQDVGSTLARLHAGPRRERAWARYERGEITAWSYNMEILDGLPLSRRDVEAFLDTVELDPGARELLAWCEARGVPFRVLSDGFDFNLNRLQQIHGVRFAYEANQLGFEGGAWRIAGGHPNPDCDCGTGTCKRGRIERFRAAHPGVTTVHIGNGRVSDTCGAVEADFAFAKGSLAEELARRGVPFEPFETLKDVVEGLERRWGARVRR